jgi:hypothetical protein
MQNEPSLLRKVRFCCNIGLIYVLTGLFAWYTIHPLPRSTKSGTGRYAALRTIQKPVIPAVKEVSGLPIRLVIPGSSYAGKVVDLPVDKGYYDQASDSWTLSGYHAQFMTVSSLANNFAGETYIYGHNNNDVFGALRHVTPAVGSTALLYTDNGHVFAYRFVAASNVAPDATSVLDYRGAPILTIQTCTGSFNEVRTLYTYSFDKVVQ